MKIKEWLQVFRAQTAPLTVFTMFTAYMAGNWDIIFAIIIFFLAIAIHFASYGQNSLLDTVMGYDIDDPAKSHHPLVTGSIGHYIGHHVINAMVIMVVIISGIITLIITMTNGYQWSSYWSIFFLLLSIILGISYNTGMSKVSPLASTIFAFYIVSTVSWTWLLSHSTFGIIGLTLLAYYFILSYFLINWAGDIKDIGRPTPSNLLLRFKFVKHRVFGNNYEGEIPEINYDNLEYQNHFYLIYWLLKSIMLLLLFALVGIQVDLVIVIYLVGLFFISYVLFEKTIMTTDRDKIVKYSYLDQVLWIFAPMPLILDPLFAMFLLVIGFAYYRFMNKYLWSADIPKV